MVLTSFSDPFQVKLGRVAESIANSTAKQRPKNEGIRYRSSLTSAGLENGSAIRCNNPATLGYKIGRLLADPARLAAMQQNALRMARPNAAFDIVYAEHDQLTPHHSRIRICIAGYCRPAVRVT